MQEPGAFKNLLLLVALGGAVGSVMRFSLAKAMESLGWTQWPWATLTVNLLGCFLVGLLTTWLFKTDTDSPMRYLLLTCFCGGFTTFSAFGLENAQMLADGRIWEAFLYTSLSLIIGIGMVFVGMWVGRMG
jgi:CrcB protein